MPNKSIRDYINLIESVQQEGVAEAGPFSYGKPPRKGSVADLAAKKRKEQEKGTQPVEPKDQMVGVAKVTKGVAEGSLNEFEAGGNFKPPKTPKGKGRGPWDDDDRSKIVLAVGQLLDGGNKVDWLVPGQMGHVVGTRDEGVSLKRLDKPHSKITYFLPISSDARDHRYQIKMKGPKHYVVVGADDDDALEEGWKSKVAGTALALGALGGIGKVIQDNPNVTINDITYAKATTMPNRELAKDLKVQTDEQGNKIYTFYYKGKHGYLRPYYYPVEKEDKHKITKIQGKEYLQHELPNNKDDVKLTTDDNGNKVYAWVQKSGMKPQYTYYWFAPAEKVNEQGVAEDQLEETSPDAIEKIEQLVRK